MEIPTINLGELDGNRRGQTMALLNQACEKWGFFQVENHGIDKEIMDKVKEYVNKYYEENMKESFYKSDIIKALENKDMASNTDWESSFFIWHRPQSNIHEFGDFSQDFRKIMDTYIDQLINLAEKLSELMCENLGLHKDYMKKSFFGGSEGTPAVGTKVAKYPSCPNPELVRGLREHTDAGGIILLLQDERVPGLEFYKDGEWVKIPPSHNNTMFINIGDQVEVLSNGRYKSVVHRVLAGKSGSRLSVATFYNPAGDAIISSTQDMLYPGPYRFKDYLKLYSETKFSDKGDRFESMKKMKNGLNNRFLT